MRGSTITIYLLSFILLSFTFLSGCSNSNGDDNASNYQTDKITAVTSSPAAEESGGSDIPDTVHTYQPPSESNEVFPPINNAIEAGFEFSADDIDNDLIMENLLYIASNPRKYGSVGEQITTGYISEKLLEYGWIPGFHDFTVYKQSPETTSYLSSNHRDYFIKNPYDEIVGNGRNVIAAGNGYDKEKKTIYLVAHHDTKRIDIDHIGLINNATGVAALLEAARLLKDFDSWFNIKFLFTGAEEYCRTGSRVFVSELSDIEKANIIGAVNVDMVGEKYAGDVVMQTYAGRHNIMSLMMGDAVKLIGLGYRSDDLSFHMGELPVITLANENSNLQIRSEDKYVELEYLDTEQLANTVELIVNYLISFDYNVYNGFLDGKASHISNLTSDKIGAVKDFKLKKINDILVENGYDSITEYTYENGDGRSFVMTERNFLFMPAGLLDTSQCTAIYGENDAHSSGNLWHYYITTQPDKFTEILYLSDKQFGTLSGEISAEEAISIMERFYRNEYKLMRHEEPEDVRFCVH